MHWQPWGSHALEQAQAENKLILISIGYAACHWCHVMEHEVFEDDDCAELMNKHFVCIKIDREERPDIDQIYMDSLQIMSGQGGWPLNIFALPNQKPVFGGTYFNKSQWLNVCQQLTDMWQNAPKKAIDYADTLVQAIEKLNELEKPPKNAFSTTELDQIYTKISRHFDHKHGGKAPAPKFMMPSIYHFLAAYQHQTQNTAASNHLQLTLNKMATGGIYDQLEGGFARYSVDEEWHIPHFEKMLYDNAQLVTLYAQGYAIFKNPLYKKIVYETIEFCKKTFLSPENAFFCALDADSQGVEGKYYVWQKPELSQVLGADAPVFMYYYGINGYSLWENGDNVLRPHKTHEETAAHLDLTPNEVAQTLETCKKKLLAHRNQRIKPNLDNKILTAWNALMLTALCEAYKVFGEPDFLEMASKLVAFFDEKMYHSGTLMRCYTNKTAKIVGFAEDYALLIQAYIAYHQVTLEPVYLHKANELCQKMLDLFWNKKYNALEFAPQNGEKLITTKITLTDDVIPSANSIMAKNLWVLHKIFHNQDYAQKSELLLQNALSSLKKHPNHHANWACLYLNYVQNTQEIVIVGENAKAMVAELNKQYAPHKLVLGSLQPTDEIGIFAHRYQAQKTLVYVCQNQNCLTPQENLEGLV